jgi:hypothetical protein
MYKGKDAAYSSRFILRAKAIKVVDVYDITKRIVHNSDHDKENIDSQVKPYTPAIIVVSYRISRRQ